MKNKIQNVKKILCLLFILLNVSFTPKVFADSSWVINNFNSRIVIQNNGQVNITEQIAVDFGTNLKHGIYRDIPVIYQNTDGNKTYTKINIISVLQDGLPAQYKRYNSNDYLRLQIGNPNLTINGKYNYEINYNVSGILRSYATYDELYWNVTGNYWDVAIQNVKATVEIPDSKIGNINCFEGPRGSTDVCNSIILADKTAQFINNNPLTAHGGLTIAVTYPKGLVPILQIEKPKTVLDGILSPVNIAAFGIILLSGIGFTIMLWLKKGRDYWFKTSSLLDTKAKSEIKPLGIYETTVVEFTPPENLRPAEIGVLMDERADTLDITATIIDLATRGYLSITEKEKKWIFGQTDYILKKSEKNNMGLLSYEKLLLEKLFSGVSIISVSELKTTFYDDLAMVKKQLYQNVMDKHLFVENPQSVRTKYSLFAAGIMFAGILSIVTAISIVNSLLLAIAIALILSSQIFFILSRSMSRRSAKGHELNQRAKGYYLFINGAEKYRQNFFEKKNLFNEILPYSIVFGLTAKFAKAMSDMGLQPKNTSWYSGNSAFNAMFFATNINSFSHSLSSAIASTPSKGGGFGGGGFSGGGFGGGGGGSW
jgi:uncharacterized membrane protein